MMKNGAPPTNTASPVKTMGKVTDPIKAYIDEIRKFANEKGWSNEDIDAYLEAIYSGEKATKNLLVYIEKLGGRNTLSGQKAAYNTLKNDILAGVAMAGTEFTFILLHAIPKELKQKDDKTQQYIVKRDSNRNPAKDKNGNPLYETYPTVGARILATNLETNETDILPLTAFREPGVKAWNSLKLLPLTHKYKGKFRLGKDKRSNTPTLSLTQIPKAEEIEMDEFPDVTEKFMKLGKPIEISAIKDQVAKDTAQKKLTKKNDYTLYLFRGTVLYTSPAGKGQKYARLHLVMDDVIAPTSEALRNFSVTVSVSPDTVKVIGKDSKIWVAGSIQYSDEYGSQSYAEAVYPVIEEDTVMIFPPEQQEEETEGEQTEGEDATKFVKENLSPAQALSAPPEFNPSAIENATKTEEPTDEPATEAENAENSAEQQDSTAEETQPEGVIECDDHNKAYDPASEVCKECDLKIECKAATIEYLNAEIAAKRNVEDNTAKLTALGVKKAAGKKAAKK